MTQFEKGKFRSMKTNTKTIKEIKKEFERVLLEYLEQDFPPQTGYLLGGQEWWRQKFGMDNRLWSWFEQQLIAHDKQMVKKIKGMVDIFEHRAKVANTEKEYKNGKYIGAKYILDLYKTK